MGSAGDWEPLIVGGDFRGGLVVLSVLFTWGACAVLSNAVPDQFFNSIRNPIKFTSGQSGVAVLFAYGLEGMARAYMEKNAKPISSVT